MLKLEKKKDKWYLNEKYITLNSYLISEDGVIIIKGVEQEPILVWDLTPEEVQYAYPNLFFTNADIKKRKFLFWERKFIKGWFFSVGKPFEVKSNCWQVYIQGK